MKAAVSGSYVFTPAFDARVPHAPMPSASAYCTAAAASAVTVLDRRLREVVAVMPTGRGPQGLALDPLLGRAYVALSGDDAVQVIDLAAREDLPRIRMQPGDRPGELALTPDARTLVVVNAGSRTAAFLDPVAGLELGRVAVGEEPSAMLLDRSGRRAYVVNRRSARITVLDLANRAVAGSIATDPEPLRVAINRAGTRLYAIHAGSAYLGVWSLPDLAPAGRYFVGLGATALKVDPRTDLVYVGRSDRRLEIYDPLAFVPVDSIELPGEPGWLSIDDAENALLALLPAAGSLAAVDLNARRVVSRVDVLPAPHALALAGERN
jgi:YVTN family beta-propeller protein